MDFRLDLGYKKGGMFRIFRRLFSHNPMDPESSPQERWVADFSRKTKGRFLEESAATHNAAYEAGNLIIRLRKPKTLAWSENPLFRYGDLMAVSEILFSRGLEYAAAGIQFRRGDEGDYYQALVSTQGYLRLDAIFNGEPMCIIPWTELPETDQGSKGPQEREKKERVQRVVLRVIALGDRITLVVNDAWAAEVVDATHHEGKVALVAADYDDQLPTEVRFTSFELDSRPVEVEAAHHRWNTLLRVPREARLNLAKSYAAIDQPLSALVQLKRAWKDGDERRPEELLLAASCSLHLSLNEEAEEYLDRCIESDPEDESAATALIEKAKLLYAENRYIELRDHAKEAVEFTPKDGVLRVLLGHAHWQLGEYTQAASAYEAAWELDKNIPLAALNAGAAVEKTGDTVKAARLYLEAARAFLATEDYDDLSDALNRVQELRPLLGDGEDAREVRGAAEALLGKRDYALGHWEEAEHRLIPLAEADDADSAVHYLAGLLAFRRNDMQTALQCVRKAKELAPTYPTYRLKLAELLRLSGEDPSDEIAYALELEEANPWTHNLAGLIALDKGELTRAEDHFRKAELGLPNDPTVRASRAELAFMQNDAERALSLVGYPSEGKDGEGILAAKGASILLRLGRWEEAAEAFEEANRVGARVAGLREDRATCLIELGRFSEADEELARALDEAPSPRTYTLLAYVASQKGELSRAEAACRIGLEELGDNADLHAALADVYLAFRRWTAAEEEITKLALLSGNQRAEPFRARLEEATTRPLSCGGCGRVWKVPKDPLPVGKLRIIAQPPDDMPAGTCPSCGTHWCIGCARNKLDKDGRFLCATCGTALKLSDEGLKSILENWLSGASENDESAQ